MFVITTIVVKGLLCFPSLVMVSIFCLGHSTIDGRLGSIYRQLQTVQYLKKNNCIFTEHYLQSIKLFIDFHFWKLILFQKVMISFSFKFDQPILRCLVIYNVIISLILSYLEPFMAITLLLHTVRTGGLLTIVYIDFLSPSRSPCIRPAFGRNRPWSISI